MNQLLTLQTLFQKALLHQETPFETHIQQQDPNEAKQRVAIYHTAYTLRLMDALKKDFTGVYYLLGDDDFDAVCQEYIQCCPSIFRSIRWYGQSFPEFLARHALYREMTMVSEMAQFEWLLAEAFDAADDVSVATVNELSTIAEHSWPTMHISPMASLRQLNLHWNTVDIWSIHADETATLESHPLASMTPYLIWRYDYQVQFRSMSLAEKAALSCCLQGEDFSAVCEVLCQWFSQEEVPLQAVLFLKTWLTQNIIAKIEL